MQLVFPLLAVLAVALFAATALASAALSLLVPVVLLAAACALFTARQVFAAWQLMRVSGRSVSMSFRYCAEVVSCIFTPLSRLEPELDDSAFPTQTVRLKSAALIELHRLQQQVAGALHVAAAEELWVSPGIELGIGEARVDGRRVRFLVVGLGLLRILSPVELRAALAHEYGHARGGHIRLGRYVRHAIRMMIHAQLRFRWFDPAYWGSAASLLVMRSIYLPWSRAREFEADRSAARLEGGEAAAGALRKIREEGPALEAALGEILRRSVARKSGPRRLSESSAALAAQLLPAERRRLAVAAEGDPLDLGGRTHPPIAMRIAALRGVPALRPLPAPAGVPPEKLTALDERLTPQWLAPLRLRPEQETSAAVAALEAPRETQLEPRKLSREELAAPTSDGIELDLDRSWKKQG
jgi:Zn-dependent protease with chaperone function